MSKLIPFWNSYLEAGKDDRNAWGCINLDRIRYIGTAAVYATLGRHFYRGIIDGCDTFVAVTYSGDNVFWAYKVLPQQVLLALSGYGVELDPSTNLLKEFDLKEVKYDE